jgi:hypothetical protein
MAYLNNIYGNAAYTGALGGMLSGRAISSAVAADYVAMRAAAVAAAVAVDALIAFDALVSTAMGITQLAITTNTIAANEQWRAGLLHDICRSVWTGRLPTAAEATAATGMATAIFTLWTAALADLVVP